MRKSLPSIPAAVSAAAFALALPGACSERSPDEAPRLSITEIEQIYQQTRALSDQIDITRSRGDETTGNQFVDLIASYTAARARLQSALSANPSPPVSEEDGRAIGAMRQTLEIYLPEQELNARTSKIETLDARDAIKCRYDPESIADGPGGYESLSKRIYECFSVATQSLHFEGEPLDRLTVFGRLALTHEPSRREGLWRAMAPIWESINGEGGSRSPYRVLVRTNTARMKEKGEVFGESVRGIGVEPEVMEQWLIRVLEKWRDIIPDTAIEPWDFAYQAGQANRALSDAIPVESLRTVNDRFYRDLGADPLALRVQYDLDPRPSKDPVAFTTFGRRPRFENDHWVLGEPWVFASYQIGGLDNLMELLHETGHAVHIAAIRTRPAFMDWPVSDIFTEGVADIATLEMYEPAWQQRYLGTSVPMKDAISSKYAAIVMDIAWALFEIRMHREPDNEPNEVWSEICQRYFRINPHPDVAWWAVRGQLINAPGYMMNYAAGAIMNADLRARAHELFGSHTEGDTTWYGRVSEHLYQFGLERTSKEVIEAFLGRPVSPQAILDDMERAATEAK